LWRGSRSSVEAEREADRVDMNRGLGAWLALSVLVHGGAVAALAVLGAAWLIGAPPAPSTSALYVDLVDPVIATSDRSQGSNGPAPHAPGERSRIGGSASRERPPGSPSAETVGVAPEPKAPPAPPASAAGSPTAASDIPRPPEAPVAPRPAAASSDSSPPAPVVARPAPPARVSAPPSLATADPAPHGAALETTISPSLALPPVALPTAPSADSNAGQPAALGSSTAGPGDTQGVNELAVTGPRDLPQGSGASTSGGGIGPARGGADLARLSSGDGPAGSASGGGIPPEYEPYVRALRQRVQDRLVYPWTAVRRGQQGVVELEVRLGADGRLVAVEVVAGVSADALREAAVSAVRTSAPFPFPSGLAARPLVVRLPVEFRLR
jgi:protein TonB